jgi:hypothetical protein
MPGTSPGMTTFDIMPILLAAFLVRLLGSRHSIPETQQANTRQRASRGRVLPSTLPSLYIGTRPPGSGARN